jgi:class 3 adenylate cyclase
MTAKILVVDDEPDLASLIRQRFRRQIRDEAYAFLFAGDGVDAVDLLQQHRDVDVVLSDINMPRMDGLTLLQKVSEVSPTAKAVIVSAYGDMRNIREAMNRGAFDFLVKPIDFKDLEITVEKTLKQVEETKRTLRSVEENGILKTFVNRSVVDLVLRLRRQDEAPVSESVHATVLFLDVWGTSSLVDREPAQDVVSRLNRQLDVVAREVSARGGAIDKFLGDAVMAVFRGARHVERALEACLALRELVREGDGALLPGIAAGVGAGEVIVGSLGSEGIARYDGTVLGAVVNTAARLQAYASRNQIVIEERLFDHVRDTYECERLGPVQFRNVRDPVGTYNVMRRR